MGVGMRSNPATGWYSRCWSSTWHCRVPHGCYRGDEEKEAWVSQGYLGNLLKWRFFHCSLRSLSISRMVVIMIVWLRNPVSDLAPVWPSIQYNARFNSCCHFVSLSLLAAWRLMQPRSSRSAEDLFVQVWPAYVPGSDRLFGR
jgi:hypothetical protein